MCVCVCVWALGGGGACYDCCRSEEDSVGSDAWGWVAEAYLLGGPGGRAPPDEMSPPPPEEILNFFLKI